ncbi:hypothetical protein HZY93_04380 [Streptococcus danieliae]|uniref:Uncharacterized protein n=1 Tax=Streptococcus danieliae TaxID=747656 RepID=A0A7Z0LD10_9STRE|nr:hypothetical protein [Streptococcus danieliae]MBF0717280.1 hypothetical protein [Streptococcus danieliae]NYS49210.1 hypothetical protein [Streptococcus danieliae]
MIQIMFIDMGLMMLFSNSFTIDWETSFHLFDLIFPFLSGILFLQYAVQYKQSRNLEERQLVTTFLKILNVRTLGVFITGLLSYRYGI